jgi:hypothetical protein
VAGSQNRRGCGGARTISRLSAGTGWSIIDDTCSARDDANDSGGCYDGNRDHSYRVYMREGESLTAQMITGDDCSFYGNGWWNGTLKVFETAGCSGTGCQGRVYCDDYESDQTYRYTAVRDGWVVIIVDGSHASDDAGDYQLNVTLSCRDGKCGCLP